MQRIPVMSDGSFRAIQAWFSGIEAAKAVDKLQAIVFEDRFPGVVNFICMRQSRYFSVNPEIVRQVATSHFQDIPITPQEGTFLDCIKSQLDGRVQIILDSESESDVVVEICREMPTFIRSFEASSPERAGFRRFIIEVGSLGRH